MGGGRGFECSKCGKRYHANTGIGFLFPEVYSELVEDISAGEYGDDFKKAFKSVKDAAVDAEKHVYKCRRCRYWESECGMSLYAPNDNIRVVESYVMPHELKEHYHIFKRYVHKCKECGSVMHKATDEEIEELKCPYCGGVPNESKRVHMCWD